MRVEQRKVGDVLVFGQCQSQLRFDIDLPHCAAVYQNLIDAGRQRGQPLVFAAHALQCAHDLECRVEQGRMQHAVGSADNGSRRQRQHGPGFCTIERHALHGLESFSILQSLVGPIRIERRHVLQFAIDRHTAGRPVRDRPLAGMKLAGRIGFPGFTFRRPRQYAHQPAGAQRLAGILV